MMMIVTRRASRVALVVVVSLAMLTQTKALGAAKHRLGPLPQNCPTARPHVFGSWHIYGESPVWAAGFIFDTSVIHVGPAKHTRHGWGFKLGWWLEPSLASNAVIHGWNLATGQGMWFHMDRMRRSALLDPAKGSVGDNGWKFYAAEEYVPSAGCYVLYAQWKSGGWLLPFAIGR